MRGKGMSECGVEGGGLNLVWKGVSECGVEGCV